MVLYICILKGCNKLVGVYKTCRCIYVRYTPTSFFTRGIHEIYTPAIEQSDWSRCTSHGTNFNNCSQDTTLIYLGGGEPTVSRFVISLV